MKRYMKFFTGIVFWGILLVCSACTDEYEANNGGMKECCEGVPFTVRAIVPETDGKEGGACSLPLSIAQVYNAKGGKVTTPVFRYKNLIASYTHLYWGEVDVMALFGEL